MVYPDNEKVSYTYNLGGLLHSMTGVKAGTEYKYLTQLGYDKFEQRTYLSYGNGTETFYTYEPERRRLHNMIAETATNRKMMDNVYTYDKVNNILKLKNNAEIPPSNLMGGQSDYNYTYDDLYQLTQATGSHKGSNQENKYSLAMKYNSVHSIVKKEQLHEFKSPNATSWTPRNKTTYTADYAYGQSQPHAPTHIGEQTYTYDPNGNQTGWTHDTSGQQRQILWDEENRIKAIADNGQLFNYVYDAAGERVLKSNGGGQSVAINGTKKASNGSIGNYTIYVNPYVVVRSSQVTKHFYIESQRIATKLTESSDGLLQTTAGNNKINYPLKQTQLQANINKMHADLDIEKVTDTAGNSGNTPPGQSGNTPPINNNAGGNGNNKEAFIFYYHPDHLGSSSYISDANGEVTQHLEYFAFGETFLEEHSNTETTPYLFNGKELDEETGLYYYGARYYDAKTSVWASVDPLAEKFSGWSPYNYCLNNPSNVVDPDGKDIIFIVDKEAASKNGHIAVLIGNEKTGWTYISMNGTGEGAKPWGKSKNADLKTSIVDTKGNMITDPQEAIQRANVINPNENDHTYDAFKRIISTEKEDINAITEASKSASAKEYGIAGPGKSCIDVAQSAFGSIVKDRGLDDHGDVPGESDLIPNNWFNKLETRVKEANANTSEKGKKIDFVIPKKVEKKESKD
jgi:RHS repeat-associated protein